MALLKLPINNLQNENEKIKDELAFVKQSVDNNEQKSRSSCLLVHGVKENEGENTDDIVLGVVNNEVGVSLSLDDVVRSHRIGPKKMKPTRSTKPRPIIFRFASVRKRMEVFKNKRNLKGKQIVITESLTKFRYQLLQKAKSKYGVKNVWTTEGHIFTKINNKLKTIISDVDLN